MPTPTWSTANRPPCSYPPDCPYAGGPGTCYASEGRTPAELHDLWVNCFGPTTADRLLDEWVRYTEQAVATCERAASRRNGDLMDWHDMACRFRGQLRELRAVRTPAAVEVAA